MKRKILIAVTTSIALTILPQIAFALSLGEAIGISAGLYLLKKVNENSRHHFVKPQKEYRRGLEDGFNHVKYDNPRNSSKYNQGYIEGNRRFGKGWVTPFTEK